MVIETQLKRRFWFNAVSGVVPDALIAAVATWLLDGGVFFFVAVVVGLQVVAVLIAVKNGVWAWVVFLLVGRRNSAEAIEAALASKGYPEPEELLLSPDDYFSGIAEDETQPVETRIAAAVDAAAVGLPAQMGQPFASIRVVMALETALQMYKRRFPMAPTARPALPASSPGQ